MKKKKQKEEKMKNEEAHERPTELKVPLKYITRRRVNSTVNI